jgi:branched-chain amino acid transport system ATP-binding protein
MNTMFRVNDLRKSYGGLKAVNGVSLAIEQGELSSIIGPNGAGKTTLFNLLTGNIKPDAGSVFFKGRDITSLPPHQICRIGIGRSYQKTTIFPRLTAYENVQVSILAWRKKSRNIIQGADAMFLRETEEILDNLGLIDKRNIEAGLLAHGDQRLLEIGITLGTHPELIMLDEPTAGMSPDESNKTMELIRQIVGQRNMTMLFIEHDMNIVFGISQRIRVMHYGAIIAEGTPQEIRANDEVQRIYLAEDR